MTEESWNCWGLLPNRQWKCSLFLCLCLEVEIHAAEAWCPPVADKGEKLVLVVTFLRSALAQQYVKAQGTNLLCLFAFWWWGLASALPGTSWEFAFSFFVRQPQPSTKDHFPSNTEKRWGFCNELTHSREGTWKEDCWPSDPCVCLKDASRVFLWSPLWTLRFLDDLRSKRGS